MCRLEATTAEVRVQVQSLDASAAEIARLAALLAPEELERATRFHFERDRNRFIVARARLREILSSDLNQAPEKIEFFYNAFGKPALRDSPIRFNVSHSAAFAAYAIAQDRQTGIDIEQIRADFAEEHIAESFFSPREVEMLRALPLESQTEAFFHCWTRKEAYVKARGAGLSIPLDSFDVEFRPGRPPAFLRGAEGWSVREFPAPQGYAGAVVAAGRDWKVVMR
jgi:4'-phosphopantetheinyl transferase